jgi:DNA-binding transcriptional regulator LsrR (DeoR family)
MAIRNNLVSFPAQIPPLMTRFEGDNHERMAHLYFVSGWSLRCLCERYRLNKAVVQNILANWRLRAMESGYIQEIQPEVLDEFARDEEPESPEMALVN